MAMATGSFERPLVDFQAPKEVVEAQRRMGQVELLEQPTLGSRNAYPMGPTADINPNQNLRGLHDRDSFCKDASDLSLRLVG
jgi:hypothetical protein